MVDVVVIGGGVVGLATARELARRGQRVVVLDKEPALGAHASGRNSGVLHAGFYYSADSLKARTCADGSRRWRDFLTERGLPLRRCGKLVVARDEAELPVLEALLTRGQANGVRLSLIDAAEAQRIEPRVKTHRAALWSPDTATTDPREALSALAADTMAAGVSVRWGEAFVSRDDAGVRTTEGLIRCARVLSAAGLQADRVAGAWGAGRDYRIVPFRGSYLLGDDAAGPLRTCVYPVPEPGMPFLGVHFTVTPSGRVKIGPTATPALWREHYAGVGGLRFDELADVTRRQAELFVRDPSFRRLARREISRLSRRRLVARASALLHDVDPSAFRTWGLPGIRAQLQRASTGALVDDFVVEAAERSLHVLNAVSPAFSSSLALAPRLADMLEAT
jgi:L-2-hydroxyglutarate oxidase